VEIFVGQENFQTVGGKKLFKIVIPPASALPVTFSLLPAN